MDIDRAMAATKKQKFEGVSVRTEQSVDDRLDRVAAELSKRASGLVVKRGAVAKTAMMRGLEIIERELGLVSK